MNTLSIKKPKIVALWIFSIFYFLFSTFFVVHAQTYTYTYPYAIPPQFTSRVVVGALQSFTAEKITQTTATISGKASASTGSFSVYVDIKQAGTFTDKFSPTINSDHTFSYKLTGLTPAFTYHFIAISDKDDKTSLSAVNTFVTPEVNAKITVSKLDKNSATIQATISEGAKNPAVIYGTQFGNLGNPVSMTLANGFYSAPISGLKENTNYYYQLVGDSYETPGQKVRYSAVFSFVTLPASSADSSATIPTIVGSDITAQSTGINPSAISFSHLDTLVQCGTGGPLKDNGQQSCGFPEAMALINRLITFLIFVVAPIIATCVALYAGILILTSAGSTENVSKAKGMIWKVVIGLVIAMGAWLLIKAILVALGVDTTVFPVFYK